MFRGRDRLERHEELIAYSIKGGISQARIAHETRQGEGRIHMNVLWEMGGCERVLQGVLDGAKGLIHGVTCGAGMPYRLAEICARYGVYYYPIVSSGRAFNALWKRAYHKFPDWLGAVVYEDPWLAGGHNGLSNVRGPRRSPSRRCRGCIELRKLMRGVGPGQGADRHGRRRLASEGLEGLDRQSRAGADRLPVRHPAATDPGEPDPGRLEEAAARACCRATCCCTASARPASTPRR